MRTLMIQAVAVLVALVTQGETFAQQPARVGPVRPLANVQPTYYGYGYRHPGYGVVPPGRWYHHASTAAQGYLDGSANLIYSQGARNVLDAQAALIYAEAQSAMIANREQATETYFAMRAANRDARAAERGPRPTPTDLARMAKIGKPHLLDANQVNHATGEVSWPRLLLGEEFAVFRAEMESLLAQRAVCGKLDRDEQQHLGQTARALQANLEQQIREVPPMDYIEAQQFIKSLAYEARQPLG